jgi:hypothetical protein
VLQDAGQGISPPGSAAAEIQLPLQAPGAGRTCLAFHDVAVSVREEGQGIDPQLTSIIVTLAVPVASGITVEILKGIWIKVVLPWLRRRHGQDVLGEPLNCGTRGGHGHR